MNQVLAEAKKHWRSQLAEPMASVEVPEWSTTLFFKPSNLAQRDRIYKHINEIGRIVTAMSDEEDVTPEEARKNSE